MSAAKDIAPDWKALISEEIDLGLKLVDLTSGQTIQGPVDESHVLITSQASPEGVLSFSLEKGFRHTVQKESAQFAKELQTSAKLVTNPSLISRFPISVILAPDQVGSESEKSLRFMNRDFSRAKDKHRLLGELEEHLTIKIKANSLRSDIITVADELLTNAIFNAPFVSLTQGGVGESRENPDIQMPTGDTGLFFAGADEERIVVGCRDPYGSLNVERLFERVRNCYTHSVAATMNMSGKGGAGIGSYMVFNSSSSYFVAVEEGKITVVCAVLPVKGSSRARQEAPKNLHYIKL